LEGELTRLAEEWKEAEEVAEIADNLFVSPTVEEWIRDRARRSGETEEED
jgi:hypothetical protein